MMDKISLQWESESLISCTCSIFINVRGSRSSIALQALALRLGILFDTNEASEPADRDYIWHNPLANFNSYGV